MSAPVISMPATMNGFKTPPNTAKHQSDNLDSSSSAMMLASHDVCVHELVQQQCEAHPESPAINAWDGNFTYGELDQKSSILAKRLIKLGVAPEVIVPLCFDKSIWTAVAVLAVMKAGGAFLLLDLEFPPARLRETCFAVEASIMLTSAERVDLARSLLGSGSVAVVDDHSTSLPGHDGSNEEVASHKLVKPENACYIVFTSGSTGKPKGIVMPHRAIATSIKKIHAPILLQRSSRVMQFASYAFDLSVYDHLFTLAMGGCLCVPSKESRRSGLADAFVRFSANWATLTPSVARILDPERLPGLEVLALAGESITRADFEKWSSHVHLLGVYGPAEFAGPAVIRDFMAHPADAANLGYSYNTVCWVVDADDYTSQLSDGLEGELALEGPCLSRGYIESSVSVAPGRNTFLRSAPWVPSSRFENTHLYLTGDIVRYNDDGSLQFLGRKDTQVKLSGQRIELGEVEYHLLQNFPEAVEVLAEVISLSTQGTYSLVAFVQLSASWNDSLYLEVSKEAEFQLLVKRALDSLKQHLPPYMVPSKVFRVHQIPSTRSGKIDRKSLRQETEKLFMGALKKTANYCVEHHEGPSATISGTLKTLIDGVLGVSIQRFHENTRWVELGGDSLLAMKLVDQARSHGMSISVSDVMGAETLADLESKIKLMSTASLHQSIKPFCLLPAQTGLREFLIRSTLQQCRVEMDSLEDMYPCTAHQLVSIPYMIKGRCNLTIRLRCALPTDLDPAKFILAWHNLVSSNPIFRTRLVDGGQGRYYQAVMKNPIALGLDAIPTEPINDSVVDLFGFGTPLVQATFYENIFVMSMNHLLFDGYSFPLVFRDLERAYEGATLPSLTFSPFMQWSSRLDDKNTGFWRESFAGFEGKHFPPVPAPEYAPLETAQLRRQLHFPPRGEFTPSNRLRLALSITFARHLGVNKVVYGDLLARRAAPIPGISDMAVPTASILPICTRVDMQNSFDANLQRVQIEASERIGYEGVDKQLLRELGEAARAACDYQTVLIIQAEGTNSFSGIFEQATTQYGNAPGLWSLCLECWLTSTSLDIKTRFDENVLSKERASKFLDCLELVFNATLERPSLSPADLVADFDF